MNRISTIGMLLLSTPVIGTAQTPGDESEVRLEEIVITGSHIEGVKNAALPIATITADDLREKGSPSPLELVKSLPYVTGAVNGENNFTNAGIRSSGAVNMNLRGLSNGASERTVVLFNGQRIAANNQAQDVNTLPMSAIGHIETLKSGGSTAYGSDAEAGVVNLITDRTLNGFAVGADYAAVRSSNGNYNGHINWGKVFDKGNILVSVGYNHTSPLSSLDRSWTRSDIGTNPTGQWLNISDVGTYQIFPAANSTAPNGAGSSFTDPGCTGLGGTLSPSVNPQTGAPVCYVSKIPFQNIIDKTDRAQFYVEVNRDLTDNLHWHTDGWYGFTNASVSAYPLSGQANNFGTVADFGGSAGTGGRPGAAPGTGGLLASSFYIPSSNPGLAALLQTYSAAQLFGTATPTAGQNAAYTSAGSNGIVTGSGWAALGLGGNPVFGNKSTTIHNDFRSYRLSTGLNGDASLLGDAKWNSNVTWGRYLAYNDAFDTVSQRLQLALRGLGGANCTGTTPGANGCQYFNPFSNAWAANGATGVANPNYNALLANDPALVKWLTDPATGRAQTTMYTAEVGLNGRLGFFELPGGPIGYAVGAQYRHTNFLNRGVGIASLDNQPCTDAGVTAANCPTVGGNAYLGTLRGAFSFGGGVLTQDITQHALGEYVEFSLPVLPSLTWTLAGRHETSGGVSITTPKWSWNWQVLNFLSLRTSYERTFKTPTALMLNPNPAPSASATVNASGQRVPTVVQGSTTLNPETTNAVDFGVVLSTPDHRLNASIDYWAYRIKDQFVQENAAAIYNFMFPTALGTTGHCGDPAYADIQARFVFSNGCNATVSSANNSISLMTTKFINGPSLLVKGLDIDVSFRQPLLGGNLLASVNATRTFEYRQADYFLLGSQVQPGSFNQVGYFNVGIGNSAGAPLPKWRAEYMVGFIKGPHTVRWTTHYVSGVDDNRFTTSGVSSPALAIAGYPGVTYPLGQHIGSSTLHDLGYGFAASETLRFNGTIANVFDKDPSFARTDMNFAQNIGSPLGRTLRLAVESRF